MANIYNSQISSSTYGDYPQLPYGSHVLTIGAHKYIAEDFNVTRPSIAIERNNEVAEQHGLVLIPTARTGDATLQMPTSSVAPAVGSTFSVTVSGSAAEIFTITEVGQSYNQNADTKLRVSFRSVPV